MDIKPTGDANFFRIIDTNGTYVRPNDWLAVVQLNGELTDQRQINLLDRVFTQKWLVKLDYDGGGNLGDCYVITGSELEVRDKVLWLINCMAGVDGHHIDNKSKWKFTDLSLVEEAIENDDKLFWGFRQSPEFFSISIEEV